MLEVGCGKFVMIRMEEGDTKGGIIIPKDKFKEFVSFKKGSIVKRIMERGRNKND
jgi:hypothetical protein